MLVEQGQLRRVKTGETTRYQPDYTRLLLKRIRTLIEEIISTELRGKLSRSHRVRGSVCFGRMCNNPKQTTR